MFFGTVPQGEGRGDTVQATKEHNLWTFDFFRRRHAFVAAQQAPIQGDEPIEGHVIWAASVAALARIHARRLGRSIHPDRRRFVDALRELVPGDPLSTISIPLLAHALKHAKDPHANGLLSHHPITRYQQAAKSSEHWRSENDRELAPAIASLRVAQAPTIQNIFDRHQYAEILYHDYRCCPVHGLDLGPSTMNWEMPSDPPPCYRNFLYVPDPEAPAQQQYRTRIMFSLAYLAQLLQTMIAVEEQAAILQEWRVPKNATLDE